MNKLIVNNSGSSKNYLGKDIPDGAVYPVLETELPILRANNDFINDLINSTVTMKNVHATVEYSGLDALAYLFEGSAIEVTTQHEKEDKILKISSALAKVDPRTGLANLILPVPGQFNGVNPVTGANGRYIEWGKLWFSDIHEGDRVLRVKIMDIDNVLGLGPLYVPTTYHDEDATDDNLGWFVPHKEGHLEISALGGFGFVPSGLYVVLTVQKSKGNYSGNVYANIKWGKRQ